MHGRENDPHTHAKIGFVVYYPFHYYVYKNIVRELKGEAEFIIDLGAFFPLRQPASLLPDIIELLKKEDVPHRILHYEDYHHGAYLEDFFASYDVLVSVWWRGCMMLRQTQHIRKAHTTYGAGKELAMFNLAKKEFDLILAYGAYDSSFFSQLTWTEVVGNPKFDDWFSKASHVQKIPSVAGRLDPNKKTVLYLPTHSDLCSIDILAEQLKRSAKEYNFITKLHYYTPREEPERVKKLTDPNIVLVADEVDLLSLLKIADVVVSDNSSAIFDVMLAGKPLVVTDFHSKEYLDTEHRTLRRVRRGARGAVTHSASIEQRIKRDGTVDTIAQPSDLSHAISSILKGDPKKPRREILAGELFSSRDGRAGQRAARAILKLREARELPDKPFLFRALEMYTNSIVQRPASRKTWAEEYVPARRAYEEEIRNTEQDAIFSVIILPTGSAQTKEALRSISEQQFPKDNYEVVELPAGNTLGERVAAAFKISKGRIVCFATDACILPSDWLLMLHLAYKRNPQIAGAGGYERATLESYTMYDEYRYRELGRKLGIPLHFGFLSQLYEVVNQIPEQNPAGTLSAMSYLRGELPHVRDLSGFRTITQLQQYLRNAVIANSPLCFIPQSVMRPSSLTRKDFISAERDRGYAAALSSGSRGSFWASLTDTVSLLSRERFSLARVMILARMARGIGTLQARMARLTRGISRSR